MSATKLVLLFALAWGLQGQCSLGCLACEKTTDITFKCSVCDLYNHYALDYKGLCTKQIIPDCELPSADRTKNFCLQCKQGFVLDKEEEKCVEVPAKNKVDKCLRYLALNHCSVCEPEHYIKDGLCVAIATAVEGCATYAGDGSTCSVCSPGHLLQIGACKKFTTTANCLVYSMSTCDTCEAGFFKEKNYYSTLKLDPQTAEDLITENKVESGTVKPVLPTVCHKQEITHCAKYLNFKECDQCDPEYYVDKDRKCTKNPYNKIPYCERYSDKVTCIECDQTHFLAANQCEDRVMVDHCEKYNTNSSVCIECLAPYYVDTNVCHLRAFSKRIQFCTDNNPAADECLSCKNRFLLTADKRACLLAIVHCEAYNPASSFSIAHFVCTTCRPGYYPNLSSSDCLKQDVVNCKQYQVNSPNCSLCDPGFFYRSTDNSCQRYTATGCLTRKPDEDKCDTCLVGHYKTGQNECLPYTIANCTTPDPVSNSCQLCEDNHFKTNGNCFKYNLIGCHTPKADKNECEVCISGYYRKHDLCWKNNLTGCKAASETENQCVECQPGFYSKNDVCWKHTIPNCDLFKPDKNECFSDGCEAGYVFDTGYCFKALIPNCDTPDPGTSACATDGCSMGYYLDNGLCRKQNIPNCVTYSSGNACSLCAVGFYQSSGTCYEQYADGCIEFDSLNTIDCTKCAEGFYLFTTHCLPYTISNCETPKAGGDACEKCLAGFVIDQTTGNCYIFDIPYCKTPDATASPPACTTCHLGYVLIAGKCYLGTSMEHCLELDSTESTCLLCAEGFYPNSNACEPQDSSLHSGNCVVFKANIADCAECKSGFQGTTCAAVTNMTNCLFSDGINDACLLCKKDFKTLANCAAVTGGTPLDSKCLGNATGTDATCSMCTSGYSMVPTMTTVYTQYDGCQTMAANNDGCSQCMYNHRLNASDLTCSEKTTGIKCSQKVADDTTALTTDTTCAICASNATRWENSGTCTDRTVLFDGCVQYTADSSTDSATLCEQCGEGLAMPKAQNYGYCLKSFNPAAPTSTQTITDCEVIQLSSAVAGTDFCITCAPGKKFGAANVDCGAAGGSDSVHEHGVATDFSFHTMFMDLSAIAGGNHTATLIDNTIGFIDCQYGYAKSIGTATAPTTDGDYELTVTRTFREPTSGLYSPIPSGVITTMCGPLSGAVSIGKVMNPADNTIFAIAFAKELLNNCESVISITGYDQLCVKCKQGFDGQLYITATDSSDAAVTGSNVSALICEKSNIDYEKRYFGASWIDPDMSLIIIDDQLQYDSCIDDRTLVVFMEVANSQLVWSKTFPAGTQKMPSMTCVENVPLTAFVENCHIYALKGDEDPNSSSDASYICTACKPGFKATVASNAISQCDPIVNCDTSDPSKNNWMNMCETCVEGSAWEADSTNHFPLYDSCIKTADPNCWLTKDNTGAECFICKRGYNVTSDLGCSEVSMTNSHCTRFGREATAFSNGHADVAVTLADQAAINRHNQIAAALHLRFAGYTSNSIGCAECDATYESFSEKTAAAIHACVANFEVFLPKIVGCKHYVGKYDVTAAECAECETGYSLKSDSTECIKNGMGIGECSVLDATPKCTTCHSGHQLHDTGGTPYCRPNGDCVQYGTVGTGVTPCVVCRDNFRPISATSDKCEEIPFHSPCLRYFEFNKCLACKNGGNAINYTGSKYGHFVGCTEKKHGSSPYEKMVFEFDGSALAAMDSSSSYHQIFAITSTATSHGWLSTNPAEICLPKILIEHCDYMGDVGCDQCAPGYALESPFSCVTGGVDNCLNYGASGVCIQCNNGFYAKTDGTCGVRVMKNCLKPDGDNEQCLVCDKGYFMDKTDNDRCVVRTNLTCEQYSRETDTCFKCRAGYYLNDTNGKCVMQDHPGCLFGNLNTSDCRVCNDGFYLDGGECVEYTFSNCKMYSPVEDKCFVCDKKYYPDATMKCVIRTKLNCDEPSFMEDKCISCEEGYFQNNDDCNVYTVDGCEVYHPYGDECTNCIKGLYYEQSTGKCVANTDPNCEEMNPYLNLCVRCIQTAFLNTATGICTNYSINCDYYNPYANTCLECPTTHYLDSGECKSYTIKNCLETKRFEDKCASCMPGFFFSVQGVCDAITVQNCDVASLRENKCVRCSNGFYNNIGVCSQYLVRNCLRQRPTEDLCVICKEGFYLKIDGTCEGFTKKGCLGFVPNLDRCASCRGGFFMQDGHCGEYTVEHCRLHDPFDDACLTCKTGYFIEGNQCKKLTVKNCSESSPDSDRCVSCLKGNFMEGYDCKPYTISNCKDLHPKADMCVMCDGDVHFRNGLGLCQMATAVSNCSKYAEYFNECVACMDGYFLENKGCTINPQGVYRCQAYLDEKNCYRCEVPYYLRDNQCVLSDTLVQNCLLYSHDGICAHCSTGTILIGNECKAHTYLDCATWSSPENCMSCPAGKVLDTSKSTTTCELIGIADCASANFIPGGPHQCSFCNSGFFLFENKCTSSVTVTACETYASETLCDKCMAGNILSDDKKTCTLIANSAGTNCSVGRHTLEPECSVCKEGYYFNSSGNCVTCLVVGCAVCDVINLRKCRLCQSGFQMTELFYCDTINAIEGGSLGDQNLKVVNESTHSETNTVQSVLRLSLAFALISLMAVFYRTA